ncbi:MAG: hypothetical protein U0235_30170 [Polyangiaceae bacterium]
MHAPVLLEGLPACPQMVEAPSPRTKEHCGPEALGLTAGVDVLKGGDDVDVIIGLACPECSPATTTINVRNGSCSSRSEQARSLAIQRLGDLRVALVDKSGEYRVETYPSGRSVRINVDGTRGPYSLGIAGNISFVIGRDAIWVDDGSAAWPKITTGRPLGDARPLYFAATASDVYIRSASRELALDKVALADGSVTTVQLCRAGLLCAAPRGERTTQRVLSVVIDQQHPGCVLATTLVEQDRGRTRQSLGWRACGNNAQPIFEALLDDGTSEEIRAVRSTHQRIYFASREHTYAVDGPLVHVMNNDWRCACNIAFATPGPGLVVLQSFWELEILASE